MSEPLDDWYWDEEAECVLARDVNGTRDGEPVEVNFADPHVGKLAAAAPALARRLLATGMVVATDAGREWHSYDCMDFGHSPECEKDRDTLTKAGVLP